MHKELDEYQQAVVDSTAGRLLVEAGPGSGKTETIAARVARMVVQGVYTPDQIAVLTYTRSMANDLRDRIEGRIPPLVDCRPCAGTGDVDGMTCSVCMGTGARGIDSMRVGTLHAIAAQIIRAELGSEDDAPGKRALRATGWLRPDCISPQFATADDVDDLRTIAKGIAGKKVTAKALTEGMVVMGAELAQRPPACELRRQLRIRDLLTYDDVLTLLVLALRARQAAGTPLGAEIPCLVVDERQDLTDAHWDILAAWGAESLTVVGDTAQAIFSFLGARDRAPEGFETLTLGGNYRSTPQVVEHNNAVRAALAADGSCSPLEQVAIAPDDDAPEPWRRTPDWQESDVVDCVQAWIGSGYSLPDIAVLGPTWAELSAIRGALETAGIVCDYPEAQADKLWSQVMGRGFVGACRANAAGHVDELDLGLILRCFGSPLDASAVVNRAMQSGEAVTAGLSRGAGSENEAAFWRGLIGATFGQVVALYEAAAPLPEKVVAAANNWAQGSAPTCADFVADLVGPGVSEVVSKPEGVAIRSIHSAKGLQWPVVVVASACEGGIPTAWQKTPERVAEGGRMLYVALTRAQEGLVVVSPGNLARDAEKVRDAPRLPSRWL